MPCGSVLFMEARPSLSPPLPLGAPPPSTTHTSNWRCHKGVRGQWLFKVKLTLMFSSGNGREPPLLSSLRLPLLPTFPFQTGRLHLTQAKFTPFKLPFKLTAMAKSSSSSPLLPPLLHLVSLCQPAKARGHAVGGS